MEPSVLSQDHDGVECAADDTEAGMTHSDQGRPIGPPGIYSEDGVLLRPGHLRGTYAPESGDDDELNLDA